MNNHPLKDLADEWAHYTKDVNYIPVDGGEFMFKFFENLKKKYATYGSFTE